MKPEVLANIRRRNEEKTVIQGNTEKKTQSGIKVEKKKINSHRHRHRQDYQVWVA